LTKISRPTRSAGTRVDGTWRVDGYDLKPYEPRPTPAIS
jgi:hypothetical protein